MIWMPYDSSCSMFLNFRHISTLFFLICCCADEDHSTSEAESRAAQALARTSAPRTLSTVRMCYQLRRGVLCSGERLFLGYCGRLSCFFGDEFTFSLLVLPSS